MLCLLQTESVCGEYSYTRLYAECLVSCTAVVTCDLLRCQGNIHSSSCCEDYVIRIVEIYKCVCKQNRVDVDLYTSKGILTTTTSKGEFADSAILLTIMYIISACTVAIPGPCPS